MSRSAPRDGVGVLLVAAGGALGTFARYGTELAIGRALLATLVGNALGCFLLGLLLFDVRADELLSKRHRLLFGTGFCASFTTYSTFVLDAITAAPSLALAYVAASYGAGFAAVAASRWVVATAGSTTVRPPAAGEES